jgi:hypothetical protein
VAALASAPGTLTANATTPADAPPIDLVVRQERRSDALRLLRGLSQAQFDRIQHALDDRVLQATRGLQTSREGMQRQAAGRTPGRDEWDKYRGTVDELRACAVHLVDVAGWVMEARGATKVPLASARPRTLTRAALVTQVSRKTSFRDVASLLMQLSPSELRRLQTEITERDRVARMCLEALRQAILARDLCGPAKGRASEELRTKAQDCSAQIKRLNSAMHYVGAAIQEMAKPRPEVEQLLQRTSRDPALEYLERLRPQLLDKTERALERRAAAAQNRLLAAARAKADADAVAGRSTERLSRERNDRIAALALEWTRLEDRLDLVREVLDRHRAPGYRTGERP